MPGGRYNNLALILETHYFWRAAVPSIPSLFLNTWCELVFLGEDPNLWVKWISGPSGYYNCLFPAPPTPRLVLLSAFRTYIYHCPLHHTTAKLLQIYWLNSSPWWRLQGSSHFLYLWTLGLGATQSLLPPPLFFPACDLVYNFGGFISL